MKEECFDTFTREGKYIGAQPKSVCHSENPGFYHKPVWIYIINDNNEILLQKRAATKKRYPNMWGLSSGGHVNSGEKIIEGAIRETEEELGIHSSEKDYKLCTEYIDDESWEIAQIYVAYLDFDIKDATLQEEEVAEIKWCSFEEFKRIVESDEHVPMSEEYKKVLFEIIESNLRGKNEINDYER